MKTAAQAFLSLSSEQWGAPCPSPYDVEPRGYARRVSPTPTARGRGLEGEAPSGLANAASGAPELRGQHVSETPYEAAFELAARRTAEG